jgi:hypothetical protein
VGRSLQTQPPHRGCSPRLPLGIPDKVRPLNLPIGNPGARCGERGGHSICFTPIFRVPPQQRLPSRSPRHLQPVFWGQTGQSCASPRIQKVPEAATPGFPIRKGNLAGREVSPPRPETLYSPLPSGTPAPNGDSTAAVVARAPFGLGSRGRLRLPLSPAARGVVTPPRVSAARGGAGKWLPARTLPSSDSARLLPPVLQCRAAAWREYKRCAGRESRRAGEEGAAHDSADSGKSPRRGGAGPGRGGVAGPPPSDRYFWRSQASDFVAGEKREVLVLN